MAEDNINYPSDIKKEKKVIRRVKKSGLVRLQPKISSTRSKGSSLINDHIIEATNKGKGVYICLPIKIYIYIRDKIRNWIKQ